MINFMTHKHLHIVVMSQFVVQHAKSNVVVKGLNIDL